MPTKNTVFISYNRSDSAVATKLALDLQQSPDVSVLIDHWEMSAGDSLLDKIETSISASSFLIVLLSSHSVESKWVRTELQYAYYKEQQSNRKFILPVVLDDCDLPIHVAGRIYIDLKKHDAYDRGLQHLLNAIRGDETFSARVSKFLAAPPESPYTDKAQREGRRLLVELAQHRELDVGENQRRLLWDLFHALLGRYECTVKVSEGVYSNAPKDSLLFELIDRWNVRATVFILSKEEFSRGLWTADVNLMDRKKYSAADLRFLGATGKLSSQGKYNSSTAINPFLDSTAPTVGPIIESLRLALAKFSEGSQQSFLFDLQSLVFSSAPHLTRVVIGSGSDDLCRVTSMFGNNTHAPAGTDWAIFEMYDHFFCSRKYTALCPRHFSPVYAADIDLMAPNEEILLSEA